MNIKEIQDSARRFQTSVREIEQFFLNDEKHLKYFDESASNVRYVLLCVKGLLIGVYDRKDEIQVTWEEFLTYLYKVHCGY